MFIFFVAFPLLVSSETAGLVKSCSPGDLELPDHSYIEGGWKSTAIGSVVKISCIKGFHFVGTTSKVITATCGCSGRWKYDDMMPKCHSGKASTGLIGNKVIMAFLLVYDYCDGCGISLSAECNKTDAGKCDARAGAWPWMAAIYRLQKGNPVFHCMGAIIGDCFVLTAAHCLQGYRKEDLLVVVGDRVRYVKEFTEKTYTVEGYVIHPEYNQGAEFNRDIGLLKLPCNITCSPFIRKGCLPRPQDNILYRSETECIVAGWGKPWGPSQKSTSMKEFHFPIADHNQCVKSTSPQYRNDVTEFTVCAGDATGLYDTCAGETGSPLFCRRHSDGRYVIVGIVSWSEGCGQPGKYGIFTHLLKLVDWVHEKMADYTCKPPSSSKGMEKDSCPKPIKQIV